MDTAESEVLTTDLRSGRHLQGVTMAPPSQPTTATTPLVIVSQPREPGKFSGTDDVDVEDWVSHYERVSAHNRWDPTVMLANLEYYLKGTAKTWYDTNEATLTSWDSCKSKLIDLFGKPAGRQLSAKQELASRAQTSTEPYVTYIQDVLALCRKVDRNMNEEDKVAHILKGIADDAFNLLLCKDCVTVDSILKECKRFEQAKSRRITQNFMRLPNTAATSSCEDPLPRSLPAEMTEESVTRIVRRELEAMTPITPQHAAPNVNLPTLSAIKTVVRDEIAALGLQPACHMSHPVGRPFPVHAASYRYYGSAQSSVAPLRPEYETRSYRNPAEWRTPDDRPICFNCRRVGHVARYCQSRWFSSAQTTWNDRAPNTATHRSAFSYQQRNADDAAYQPPRFGRSPSPQRRQSRSPQPRRSTSPANYGRPNSEN